MKRMLVMDKECYSNRNQEFIKLMEDLVPGDNTIVHTSYEDDLIRKVRNYKYIGLTLQHLLYWKKSYDYAKNIMNQNVDTIYCINPIVGIFLGLFNRKKEKKRILLGGFLFEPKKNKIYYNIRKWFAKLSLKGIDKAIVYGKKEVDYYYKIFKLDVFMFIKYGIDFDPDYKYTNTILPEHYFFSGGGSNRDYETLINAYNHCSNKKAKMIIATQPWRLIQLDTSKIIVLSDVVVENFGDVLERSDVLVLSLNDANISAGHMVMFQAMSLGIPVIVNDISAIRDYVNDESVVFYPSRDMNALIKCLNEFGEMKEEYHQIAANAKRLYENELTYSLFLKRFLSI